MAGFEIITWQCRSRSFECGRKTLIAGILNITPDSFSDGGHYMDPAIAVARALEIVAQGADIIDIGGESSRPGAEPVDANEELARVIPVIEAIRKVCDVPISIDTSKAAVAHEAIARGAEIVNDISALRGDPYMARVVAESGAGAILMHMRGTPRTMQTMVDYEDVVGEVEDFLRERLAAAMEAGIPRERICLDPGIGFAKGLEANLDLLAASARFRELGAPVMIGASRKAFIGKLTGAAGGEGRMAGSVAACVAAVLRGADIVRVHNVAETRQAVAVADALRERFLQ